MGEYAKRENRPRLSGLAVNSVVEPAELLFFGQIEQAENSHIDREQVNRRELPKRFRAEIRKKLGHGMSGEASREDRADQRLSQGADTHHHGQHDDGNQVFQRNFENRGHNYEWVGGQWRVFHGHRQQRHGKIETSKDEGGDDVNAGSRLFAKDGDAVQGDSYAKSKNDRACQLKKTARETIKGGPPGHFLVSGCGGVDNVLHERKQVSEEAHQDENRSNNQDHKERREIDLMGTQKIQGRDHDGAND